MSEHQPSYPPPVGGYQPPPAVPLQSEYPPPPSGPAGSHHDVPPPIIQPGSMQYQLGQPQMAQGGFQPLMQPPPENYQQMPQRGGYQALPGYTDFTPQPIGVQPLPPPVQGYIMRWPRIPQTVECSYCRATVTTAIRYQPGVGTWLLSGGICILGFWMGCCLIPFCVDQMKDASHVCPNCNQVLGESKLIN